MASEAARWASLTWSRASASSRRASSARRTSAWTGSKSSAGAGRGAASGSTGSAGGRARSPRKRSRAEARAASERTMASRACAACSSARNTSSLLARPTWRRASEDFSSASVRSQALPRHLEELALGDDAVEGRRHLDGEALLREGERALLPLHRAPGVRELEEGGVRPDAAEERLAEQEPKVGRLRERGVGRGLGEVAPGRAQGAARPRQLLREVDAQDRPLVRALVDRGDGRIELADGGLLLPARGEERVHGVEKSEVPLEGEAHGRAEAHGRGPFGRAHDPLRGVPLREVRRGRDLLRRGHGPRLRGESRRRGGARLGGQRLLREHASAREEQRRLRRGGRFSRRDEVSGLSGGPSNGGFGSAAPGLIGSSAGAYE